MRQTLLIRSQPIIRHALANATGGNQRRLPVFAIPEGRNKMHLLSVVAVVSDPGRAGRGGGSGKLPSAGS